MLAQGPSVPFTSGTQLVYPEVGAPDGLFEPALASVPSSGHPLGAHAAVVADPQVIVLETPILSTYEVINALLESQNIPPLKLQIVLGEVPSLQ